MDLLEIVVRRSNGEAVFFEDSTENGFWAMEWLKWLS
jgi:hypothetical protein